MGVQIRREERSQLWKPVANQALRHISYAKSPAKKNSPLPRQPEPFRTFQSALLRPSEKLDKRVCAPGLPYVDPSHAYLCPSALMARVFRLL